MAGREKRPMVRVRNLAPLRCVHRLETVAVFRFLFDAKKEQLSRKLPLAKKRTSPPQAPACRNPAASCLPKKAKPPASLPGTNKIYLLLASAGRRR
ncbi:hypothetical protein, partial [uncultured Gemmiger sp.]|uniref:hypothetical protein n=1 Tax=uncultured Gemmiger sp. TaxID=1623490 RepID=UPI0025F1FBEC